LGNWITVFTHKRPECLYLCLESLVNCRRIENYSIYLASNENSSPEIRSIAKELLHDLNYEIGIRPEWWLANRANGEAIKAGIARSDKYTVALGEDEVLAKDYLEMIETIITLNTDEKLLSISGNGLDARVPSGINPDEWLIKMNFFIGLNSTILKEPFEKYVKQYFCEEYYKGELIVNGVRMHDIGWMATVFPEFQYNHSLTLDGLTVRAVVRHGLHSLTSLTPRAHEIGFYGSHVNSDPEVYNRLFKDKTLQEKVAVMKDVVSSGKIRELFGGWAAQYREMKDDHQWKTLYVRDSKFDFERWKLTVIDDGDGYGYE
jgi:hypothetical protein